LDRLRQQELIQEIKEKNDIVSVISEYVSLRKAGRSWVGLCPFHSEKTGSFNVNPEKQFFYCFGCSAGGDVFSFIMKRENLEFMEAARKLAERAGIAWPESNDHQADQNKNESLKINQLAASYFHYCLFRTEQGKRGREYLERRGIDPEIWRKFSLGYAPPGWHHLTETLRKKNVPLEKASTLGLVSFGENGYYDRFRDRIIFPICDPQGNVVGFGGRVLDQGEPKYLNSPETALFHKGRFLYGLQLAKETIRRQNQAIIMEGYMDVVQAHQGGFQQAIASLGTALTQDQVKLIKRYGSEVILAYDADTAGQNATLRGMGLLREAGLTVKILRLPAGEDPDSFLKKAGEKAFREQLAQAPGLIEFKIEQALRKYDLNSSEGKLGAVQAVLPELGEIESSVAREFYIRQLAREIGVSENAVFAEVDDWLAKNRKKSPVLDNKLIPSYTKMTTEKNGLSVGTIRNAELSPIQAAIFEAEKELLQIALQEYDKFARIKEELKAEDFQFAVWRDFFGALQDTEPAPENHQILDELTGPIRELASTLLAEQQFKSGTGDLAGILNRLDMLRLKARIQKLTEQIATGKDDSGLQLSEADLKAKLLEFTELNRRLKKEYPSFSAEL
jgi:DNA primase